MIPSENMFLSNDYFRNKTGKFSHDQWLVSVFYHSHNDPIYVWDGYPSSTT